jgi:hypothetical protein
LLFLSNFKSKIVDEGLTNELYKLCEFTENQKWSLLYRASEHGFDTADFHANCDNKSKTLTIIKSTNGNIFGGYTDSSWDPTTECRPSSDRNAFLFSLINLHKQPTKIKINQNFDRAITYYSDHGPAFGNSTYGATELILAYQPQYESSYILRIGHSKLATCYQPPNYPQGSNGSNFLAGSENFDVTDVEVFMKI